MMKTPKYRKLWRSILTNFCIGCRFSEQNYLTKVHYTFAPLLAGGGRNETILSLRSSRRHGQNPISVGRVSVSDLALDPE